MNKKNKLQVMVISSLLVTVLFLLLLIYKINNKKDIVHLNQIFPKIGASVVSTDGEINLSIPFYDEQKKSEFKISFIKKIYLQNKKNEKVIVKKYDLKEQRLFEADDLIVKTIDIKNVEFLNNSKNIEASNIVIEFNNGVIEKYDIGRVQIYRYKKDEIYNEHNLEFLYEIKAENKVYIPSFYLSVIYNKSFEFKKLINEDLIGKLNKKEVRVYKNSSATNTYHNWSSLPVNKVSIDKIKLKSLDENSTNDTLFFTLKDANLYNVIIYQPLIKIVVDGEEKIFAPFEPRNIMNNYGVNKSNIENIKKKLKKGRWYDKYWNKK